MSAEHPKSIFSQETWKGENGDSGLRNLHGAFMTLLAMNHLQRHENNRTSDQRELRIKAAAINFNNLYNIQAKAKNHEYISPREAEVLKRVNYDIDREILRGILRAFESTVKNNIFHPDCLINKQSHMREIFVYISENITELRGWEQFPSIQRELEKMNIKLI